MAVESSELNSIRLEVNSSIDKKGALARLAEDLTLG